MEWDVPGVAAPVPDASIETDGAKPGATATATATATWGTTAAGYIRQYRDAGARRELPCSCSLLAGLAYWGWSGCPAARAQPRSPRSALVSSSPPPCRSASSVFWEGLKTGLLTFGGAYTAVPLLQEQAVDVHGWLTEDQFLDGLAISGILPAPLIIFSTFVGYLAGGLGASLLMTLGVFLPAFLFPLFLHERLVAVAGDERLRPFLLGVAAAVVGLIAAVTVDLLDASVPDVPSAVLALGAFAVLYRVHGKLTVLWVVLGCGVLGALLQLTVL